MNPPDSATIQKQNWAELSSEEEDENDYQQPEQSEQRTEPDSPLKTPTTAGRAYDRPRGGGGRPYDKKPRPYNKDRPYNNNREGERREPRGDQPRDEMIEIIKNDPKDRIWINLYNLEYNVTSNDIYGFYEGIDFDAKEIKRGFILVELPNKEEAVKFVQRGSGEINNRRFYMKIGYGSRESNNNQEWHSVNKESNYDLPQKQNRYKGGSDYNRKEQHGYDGDQSPYKRGGGRGGRGGGRGGHEYKDSKPFGRHDNRSYYGSEPNTPQEGGFDKFFANRKEPVGDEPPIKFINKAITKEEPVTESLEDEVPVPIKKVISNKPNPFGDARPVDPEDLRKKKEDEEKKAADDKKLADERRIAEERRVEEERRAAEDRKVSEDKRNKEEKNPSDKRAYQSKAYVEEGTTPSSARNGKKPRFNNDRSAGYREGEQTPKTAGRGGVKSTYVKKSEQVPTTPTTTVVSQQPSHKSITLDKPKEPKGQVKKTANQFSAFAE